MDTRLSSAIHALILISEADVPMTSEQIAVSVGTNASYIRKILGLLKKGGIIEGHRGISGFSLKIAADELTIFQIYQAISGNERLHLFDLHQNPNDACIVGRHIRPVLSSVFQNMEEQAQEGLKRQTLGDCIRQMKYVARHELAKEREKE